MVRSEIRAYIVSCEERADVCNRTIADLDATDWGGPPVVVLDDGTLDRREHRITESGRRLLERAVSEVDDLFLYLEDDVWFNRWLRHNLEAWEPIAQRRAGEHFFGSLYNPNIVAPASPDDPAPYVVIDPRQFYGAQGVVLSVATARSMLEQWDEQRGLPDIRMSRLAARRSPLYIHRPSLVEHRAIPSTWGGAQHRAVDFAPDWRA